MLAWVSNSWANEACYSNSTGDLGKVNHSYGSKLKYKRKYTEENGIEKVRLWREDWSGRGEWWWDEDKRKISTASWSYTYMSVLVAIRQDHQAMKLPHFWVSSALPTSHLHRFETPTFLLVFYMPRPWISVFSNSIVRNTMYRWWMPCRPQKNRQGNIHPEYILITTFIDTDQ